MGIKSKYPERADGHCFGLWTVVGRKRKGKGELYYVCRCGGCGKEQDVYRANLELGKSLSCVACANARNREEQGSVYLLYREQPREQIDRLANRYYAIISRCRGVGAKSPRYINRGITCEFSDVYDFVGYCLTLDGVDDPCLQIDREDNDGNYTRGNLRFVSSSQNNRNKEVHRWINYQGRDWTAIEFHERFAPIYRCASTVCRKIREGLTAEQIISDQQFCKGAYLRHSRRRAA
jgi:hypothetical protein